MVIDELDNGWSLFEWVTVSNATVDGFGTGCDFAMQVIFHINPKYWQLQRSRYSIFIKETNFSFDFDDQVGAVYDLTIGFKKSAAEPTLLSVLKGRSCQAEIYIR